MVEDLGVCTRGEGVTCDAQSKGQSRVSALFLYTHNVVALQLVKVCFRKDCYCVSKNKMQN